MADRTVFRNARLVNEGRQWQADLLVKDGRIEKISAMPISVEGDCIEIVADGFFLLPGLIDDQVHFREPGLTHKATIATESAAAAAGGVTSFMEMPNTNPAAVNLHQLEEKYDIAQRNSVVNHSFYLGATNDNLDELLRADYRNICGIKVFMGSSTGNMLVDHESALESIFREAPTIVAVHAEKEEIIQANLERAKQQYGDKVLPSMHPLIRSADACYRSSSEAIARAERHGTRLHVLHISTEQETVLFEKYRHIPRREKRITSEVCVHHLWFSANDYPRLGNAIKCNPAIKGILHQKALRKAFADGVFDILATDHAPHAWEEKSQSYLQAPSGLPLVQHSLLMGMQMVKEGLFSMDRLVDAACHSPADIFRIPNRGYLREGYWADLVLVNPSEQTLVSKANLLYKCGWSPIEGESLGAKIAGTWVNGVCVYRNDKLTGQQAGMRLHFEA